MAAYCVGRIVVRDRTAWEDYRSRVGATIARHGGEVIFRGATTEVFSGHADEALTVAIRFADIAAARAWHDSPDYQALVPLRERGADVTLVAYEEQ